jgi:hypothetical protein
MEAEMTPETTVESTVLPASTDHIRIVPLYVPEELAAPPAGPAPKLTYRGGPLLGAVQVFTVFWGPSWNQSPQHDLIAKLNGFFDFVLTSPLLDELTEYSVPGQAIGHGRHIGTATITTPAPRAVVSDAGVQHMLQQEISTRALPAPTPQTLYFVYLPPGVAVVQGGARSCQAFCGYHNSIGAQLYYAVMPYPGCKGCTGTLAPFDALTSTSSHELVEAITDAVPGQGWYDDVHGEIGDICAWKTKTLGAYTVQLEWSNEAKNCI